MIGRGKVRIIILYLPNGETIEILLTEYRGLKTLVGIQASPDVLILRNELVNEVSM